MRLIGKSIITILISAFVGTVLLVIVSLIPQNTIYKNTKDSMYLLCSEGSGIDILSLRGSTLDVFTDSLMLSTAFKSAGNLYETMMATRFLEGSDDQPLLTLQKYFEEGDEGLGTTEYARYWHGYLIFLRPLLCVGSLISIRALNMLIQFSLVALALTLLYRKGKAKASLTIPFFVMWMTLSPVALTASLQYYSSFYSMMFAVIALLLLKDLSFKKIWYVFLTTGILIGFFDLLTYPLVSLGVPLILFFSLDYESKKKVPIRIWECVAFSVAWCAGNMGMLVCRWIITSIISGNNVFKEGMNRVIFRTMHKYADISYSFVGTFKLNMSDMLNQLAVFAVGLGLLIFVLNITKIRRNVNFAALIALLLVTAYPLIWYFVVMQHSNLHHWMTYRNFSVAIYGIMSLLYVHIDFDKRKGTLPHELKG